MSTELVLSVSIANMVTQRAAVIGKIPAAAELMREAAQLAGAAHLGMPRVTISNSYGRGYSSDCALSDAYLHTDRAGNTHEYKAREKADSDKVIRLGVDCAAWQYLMHESGMRSLMDATARAKWDKAISEGDIPELNEANVRSTFGMLHDSRGEIFERGVIAVFKGLAWCYKTNLPQKFGKRVVISYMRSSVTGGTGSLGYVNHLGCDKLDDLTRVFHVLDGKPEPDHRKGWYSRLMACAKVSDPDATDDYFSIRSFRNGNGHVTFKRLDLVDKMNLIIAKHYPGALPAPK